MAALAFVDDDPTHRGDPVGLINIAGMARLFKLLAVGVERAPVARRAAMARYALDRSGSAAPIGLGEEIGTPRDVEMVPSRFEHDPGTTSIYELCEQLLGASDLPRRSVRGCFTAPFRVAAWLVGRPDLWSAFGEVTLMGGVDPVTWRPDSALNNRLDPGSAERFYRGVQESGTPATLIDREFAIWAKVPKRVWLQAEESGDPWVAEIGAAMRRQWERLWDAVCEGKLPPDRTVTWYLDGWCDGARPPPLIHDTEGHWRLADGESITHYVVGAPAYDVLAGAALDSDQPLGKIEVHPGFPSFTRLRPDLDMGFERAVRAQMRIITAALGGSRPAADF